MKPVAISCVLILVTLLIMPSSRCQVRKKDGKPKKDLRDYTDADLERLYEEWEVIMKCILKYSLMLPCMHYS